DALEEIDVVAARPARSIGRDVGLDRDAHRRADRLAELARDAALLPVRVAAERMQAPEARGLRGLLLGIVEGVFVGEERPQRNGHSLDELRQQEGLEWVHVSFVRRAASARVP